MTIETTTTADPTGRHHAPLLPPAGKMLRYALLPQILPRLKTLTLTPFRLAPYLVALMFLSVRLLPAHHPYLQRHNFGRYGFRHVIAAAAGQVKCDRQHIDQVIMFAVMLSGFVIGALYLIGLIVFGMITPVAAATFPVDTPSPARDIALNMLDRVFGVPGVFGSAASQISPFPDAFHVAFQSLLAFYSSLMFFMALIAIFYVVVVTIYETAAEGKPFGQRFDTFFTPLRLVIALGLLVPVGYGMNTAQYMVLYAAKWGSGLATNGWLSFNTFLANPGMGSNSQGTIPARTYIGITGQPETVPASTYPTNGYVALARVPDVSETVAFMHMARTCMLAYGEVYGLKNAPAADEKARMAPYLVAPLKKGLLIGDPNSGADSFLPFARALEYSNKKNIVIRIGQMDAKKWPLQAGNVFPFCGEIAIPIQGSHAADLTKVSEAYYNLITQMLGSGSPAGDGPKMFATAVIERSIANANQGTPYGDGTIARCSSADGSGYYRASGGTTFPLLGKCTDADMGAGYAAYATSERQRYADDTILKFLTQDLERSIKFDVTPEMKALGWAGAGIWYNKIAEINGLAVTAVQSQPQIVRYPEMLEKQFREARETGGLETALRDVFARGRAGSLAFNETEKNTALMNAFSKAFEYWNTAGQQREQAGVTSNALEKMIAGVFGAESILHMRSNSNVHPSAQLSMLGRGLIEKALVNIAIGGVMSGLGGAMGAQSDAGIAEGGKGVSIISGMMFSIAGVGLSVGFIMYYLIPFFPFIYFFFAVGNWVKSVFEALVGVPLWALAHLHVDGKGMIPEAAQTGYLLLLEIFLRPIMVIFGLMAAITIFAASANALDVVWDLVNPNLAGHAPEDLANGRMLDNFRGAVDRFFYLVMYAVILYMMALSCFKLIDDIPNNLIRFIGSGANSFADKMEQPAPQMLPLLSLAVNQGFKNTVDDMKTATSGAGSMIGELFDEPPPPPLPDDKKGG